MTALIGLTLGVAAPAALAQPGWVLSHQKISDTEGDFTGFLYSEDWFGTSVASLGDLDGDGVGDLAVGAIFDDDGANGSGTVWVLFLNTDGTVDRHQKISNTQGGFTGDLDIMDRFGQAVAWLGDLDGDDVGDLAVGAHFDDDGGTDRGAVWVLFLNTDGTVKDHQKISDTEGGFDGILDDDDHFGFSVASLGDLDGDDVGDLAVGAHADDDGGTNHGAVWVLFLNTNGTVKDVRKISDTEGGFTGILDDGDRFGVSAASLGDLDGDGVGDLAVGAMYDDDEDADSGAAWMLFLNSNGTVKSHQKISDTEGGFDGILDDGDWFGRSMAWLDDLDGDGVGDLAVGASKDDDGGSDHGAVWILFLNTNGTVKDHQKISDIEGGFTGILGYLDTFGVSVASLGDHDGDGLGDLVVGANKDDDGPYNNCGAVWVLFLDGVCTCPGDFDCDEDVDTADLLALLAAWGDCPFDCPWDFNGDGVVDELDEDILMEHWGDCPEPPEECPWDLNGDGIVDFQDLTELQEHFGPCPLDECPTDMDYDDDTDTADLLILLGAWGGCP
jgi:hypothetical protein